MYSLLQSRSLPLRVLNLAACLILTVLNCALEVWPMVEINIVLAAITLWFILQLMRDRHDAAPEVLQVRDDDEVLRHLLRVHAAETVRINPEFTQEPGAEHRLVTRGAETSRIVLTAAWDTTHMLYVTPRYGDFSPGEFIWRQSGMLSSHGDRRVVPLPAMMSPHYDRVGYHPLGDSWALGLAS